MSQNKNAKILIVDDAASIIYQLQQILGEEGYEIFVATGGEKALLRIEQNKPDLILLDIIMPVIDGFETCRRIKAIPENRDIPIIFMSALLETFDKIKAFGMGAVDYITKPLNTEELLVRIKTHLSISKLQVQLKEANGKLEEKVRERTSELQKKNEEYEALNEELSQTNEELGQTNEELYRAKERAEENEQLKTAFLQNISHEIRTPMNAICGFTERLNRPDLPEEKRKQFTSIIKNSSYQLLSIVTNILTISSLETKQEKICIETVGVNQVMDELNAIFSDQADNKHLVLYPNKQLTDDQTEIYTDKTKLTQILSNLIHNSLKFTDKGYVEFGYKLVKDQKTECKETAHFLQFYVKDTGIGISKETQEIIFERFRQASKSIQVNYGGSGLGLSISKAFVELLGGRIWLESTLDIGSTFYFTIPYKSVKPFDKSIDIPKLSDKRLTILIAEDVEYNFLFIEELFIDMDFQLIRAKNGKEALDLCRSHEEIRMVLMDIRMPIMDGYSAAKMIKRFRPNLPIIALSAYALEQEMFQYSSVFNGYITKPIEESALKSIIEEFIHR